MMHNVLYAAGRARLIALLIGALSLLCNCSKSPMESTLQKMTGPFSWHGECQYGYWSINKAPNSGSTYYNSVMPIKEEFGFQVVSSSIIMLTNNKHLAIDTALFSVYRDDEQTLELALTKKVFLPGYSYPFSPYNKFPDTVIYDKAKNSITLSSGNKSGGYYANYIWLTTP